MQRGATCAANLYDGQKLETDQGNKYFLVTIDYFCKRVEEYDLPNQEDATVTKTLVKD